MGGVRVMIAVVLLLGLVACGSTATSTTPDPPSTAPSRTPSTTPSATTTPTTAAPTPPTPSITIPSLSIPPMPTPSARGLVEGADASWPQCPKGLGIPQKRTEGKPMPLPSAQFVVLGLTNGPGFVANPCLRDQVAWVKQRHLLAAAYSIISAPYGDQLARYGTHGPFDAGTASGRLSNVGYQEALFNIATMKDAGLRTPIVWLDIEPVADFDWGSDTAANAAVVQGAARGYRDSGYDVGVYSIASLWKRVVGDLRLGLPEWRPAGSRGAQEALSRCGGDWMFQGGAAVLAQWVDQDRDRDVTCPGQSTYLSLWFHQY